MEEEIYLDKIQLGAIIIQKELTLIEIYNSLIHSIRMRPEILEMLNDYPNYHTVWRNLCELYDFLEYDYVNKLKSTKDKDFIKNVVTKYKQFKKLSIEDLNKAMDIIRKIMSISKFHDIIRKMGVIGIDKVKKTYGIK